MKPDGIPLQLVATLAALPSALSGFLMLALALVFQGNFRFGNAGHLLVFTVTVAMPFVAIVGLVWMLRHPSWRAFWCSLMASSGAVLTVLLWNSPLARSLIH